MHYTWWIFRSFIECILKTNFVQGDDNVLLLLSGPLNSFPNKNMTTRSRLNPSFFEDLIVDHFQFWVTWFRPSFEYIFTCKFTKTAITQNWKRQPRSSKKMKIWSDEFIYATEKDFVVNMRCFLKEGALYRDAFSGIGSKLKKKG